jgi:hypothetical protein
MWGDPDPRRRAPSSRFPHTFSWLLSARSNQRRRAGVPHQRCDSAEFAPPCLLVHTESGRDSKARRRISTRSPTRHTSPAHRPHWSSCRDNPCNCSSGENRTWFCGPSDSWDDSAATPEDCEVAGHKRPAGARVARHPRIRVAAWAIPSPSFRQPIKRAERDGQAGAIFRRLRRPGRSARLTGRTTATSDRARPRGVPPSRSRKHPRRRLV